MEATPMRRSRWVYLLFLLSLICLGGCGGGALTLTGGSVPIGGRAVSGVVLLPDGAPVVKAQVTVKALPSGSAIQKSTTDANGRFALQGVPISGDISVVVNQPPSNVLEVVVPRATLADHPDQPLDIGSVTALTTVVAEAIHLEHGPAPEDANSIVSNQEGQLTMQVHDAGYSIQTQQQFIRDPNSLMAQALTLIVPTANTELSAFAAAPTSNTASAALNGLLGYVRAAHKRSIHLSSQVRTTLTNAQLSGKVYSPDVIASSLQAAGVQHATAVEVSSGSEREHAELTALGTLGNGITAFEALVIAADVNTNGGFQLDQNDLNRFLAQLLK
jgi:hypothetical protein